jgi:CelD/BcsL family acetyltransferase involved in cellulose biosynthesis
MDIVFSEDARDFVRRDWSSLVTADPAGTLFHTPGFLKLYWEEFAREPQHLLLAFAEEGGVQVGAVAFERLGDTLRFLGGTDVTDYLGPVGVVEAQGAVAKELFAALARRDDWTVADLRGLPEDRAWLELLTEGAAAQGFSPVIEDDEPNAVAPFLQIPGSFEEYLAALPSKLRHEIKRKARKLEAEAGPWRICLATHDTLEEYLDRFVELHRMSEGPKGVFMRPGMEIFFRRLAQAFLPRGIFNLTFIEVEGVKAAGTIGFRFEGTYYLYNSAFDRAYQALSPGMVLVAEDIRIAIEGGCSGFDMLKGDYAYKYRFGAVPRRVKRLVVTR